MDDDGNTSTQALGEATVLVHYDLYAGQVSVQGCTIAGEWVDAEDFSGRTIDRWRFAIQAEVQREEEEAAANAAEARAYALEHA